jgi:cytochrome oxidase assembly protein ShyY1
VLRVLLSPRMLGVHALGLVATVIAGWLGVWQLGAWQEHREAQATDLASAPARALSEVMSPDAPFPADAVGRPVKLRGTWVDDATVFVGNRDRGDRAGYWVVTPLAVCADQTSCRADAPAMLVVRGWTPTADAPVVGGTARVTGWLQPPEGAGLPDPTPNDAILPELRIASVIQHVDQDLYGAFVIGKGTASGGLAPVTPASLPEPDAFTSLRNLLYALEWWVFGGFALLVWWRWCRDEVVAARTPVTEGTAEPDREPAEPGVPSRS